MIEAINLTKKFDDIMAVDHINAKIKDGFVFGLIGTNGAGKSTFLRMASGVLKPDEGSIQIDGNLPGVETKKIVSYLPERTYLTPSWKVRDLIFYFEDFYEDFRRDRAQQMLEALGIGLHARLRTLSKGTREKVQLVMVMSRDASLYILDEPIGGVDPAARDYILNTILTNYNENATILLSTHLISDIENILDHVIFLQNGQIVLNAAVDKIRMEQKKSVDMLFREVFRC